MKEGIWEAVEKAFDVKKMETLWEKDAKKIKKLHELQQERDKYKSIVEEINEYMKEHKNDYIYEDDLGEDWYFQDLYEYDDLLKILNKIKELEEGK